MSDRSSPSPSGGPAPAIKSNGPAPEAAAGDEEVSAGPEVPPGPDGRTGAEIPAPVSATRSASTEPAAATSTATDGGTAATDAAPGQIEVGVTDTDPKPTSPEERWTDFATAKEAPATWIVRAFRACGRAVVHEYTLVTVGAILLAVVMTWPALRYPQYTIAHDIWDPTLQAWQIAWSGHALLTDPLNLWNANSFHPEQYSLAFSDSLLGYAPAGMVGTGPEAAVLRYNIIFVLAHALAVIGAYALVRQLGAGRIGATVAGVAFAYAPWRLAQEGHLNIISSGGIPLALAMLARGHGYSLRHGYRPERRHTGWAVAGWVVATWQISLGFGIGLPFAYVLGVTALVSALVYGIRALLRRRKPFGMKLLVADVLGGAVFAGAGALLALPYYRVAELHPYAQRSPAEIEFFSPPWRSLMLAPRESLPWGDLHEPAREGLRWGPEMTLLPGYALYALALIGLIFSVWKLRTRLLLLVGAVASIGLSMGTEFFAGTWTYLPLYEYLPGWNGIRTPGRLIMWATLFLGLLGAGAVSEFGRQAHLVARTRIPSWPGPWLRIATLLPLVLVVAEGTNRTEHPIVPPQPVAMRTVEGPMLVLPTTQLDDQNVMLWSTTKFQQLANGGSGVTPRRTDELRQNTTSFPDVASIGYLRSLGIRTVVLLRDRAPGSPWERAGDVPVDSLGIQRQDLADTVVFRL